MKPQHPMNVHKRRTSDQTLGDKIAQAQTKSLTQRHDVQITLPTPPWEDATIAEMERTKK